VIFYYVNVIVFFSIKLKKKIIQKKNLYIPKNINKTKNIKYINIYIYIYIRGQPPLGEGGLAQKANPDLPWVVPQATLRRAW
jgi:hypothetical protein